MKKRILVLAIAVLQLIGVAQAQTVGIKTNLISDAALSPNLGLEIGLARKWSLDLTAQTCLWDVKGHKWKHWMAGRSQ